MNSPEHCIYILEFPDVADRFARLLQGPQAQGSLALHLNISACVAQLRAVEAQLMDAPDLLGACLHAVYENGSLGRIFKSVVKATEVIDVLWPRALCIVRPGATCSFVSPQAHSVSEAAVLAVIF